MKYYNEQVRFSVGLYTGSEATRSACAPRGLSGESPCGSLHFDEKGNGVGCQSMKPFDRISG